MSSLEKAIEIAALAHAGQKDKGGHPYILHPIRVMMSLKDHVANESLLMVAVLHDVLEDTGHYVLRDLDRAGFSVVVIEAVMAITRKKSESYMDYIQRLAKNPLAKHVKIMDLQDNMDLSRIQNPGPKDFERQEKYSVALDYLRRNNP